MKAISIKQPWAHLIASGIKDIENRTWRTTQRGTVYIHASAKLAKAKDGWSLLTYEQEKKIQKDCKEYKKFLDEDYITGAIIGQVDIIDCVINHGSIWAEKTELAGKTIEGDLLYKEKPIYNWVLANAVLYDKPIIDIKGKLNFWEFRDLIECRCCTNNETNEELYICQICEQEFCGDCQTPFTQHSEIDYNCCSDCGSRNHRD